MRIITKPGEAEFQDNEPLLAGLIPGDGLLLAHLSKHFQDTRAFMKSLPEGKLIYRYDVGKWTIKEMLMHMIDMERIYAYRILCFARNDKSVLPAFDDEQYVLNSGAGERDLTSLLDEFEAVRESTIRLLNGLTGEAILRTGMVNNHAVTVRALAYHIAGHELHHLNVIRERYL